jgi:outer membrane protein TolC
VRAAMQRAAAAKALSGEPLSRALPTLEANATYRTTNETGAFSETEDWWFGATANWILFDGGERYADRREQKARARIASLQASALERRARVAVEQARIGLLSAQAAFSAARAQVDAARRNERETSALYEQGLASALEATTARVSLFEAEVALVREQYGLASAYLAIPEAMGQDPFGRDVAEASR